MDELNKCLICRNFRKEVFALQCGHKIVCAECCKGQVFCEDCRKASGVERLLLGNDFFDERRELSYLNIKIEDEVLARVYRNVGRLEDKKRFLRVYKNFFCDNKCFGCEAEEISFLDFREVKGYCHKCKTGSSVYTKSEVIGVKNSNLQNELFNSMTVYAIYLFKQALDKYTESYLMHVKMHLFTQFGKGLNGYVSRCPWCGGVYDYVNRVPLVYTCKFKEKHIFCTQCYFRGAVTCIFDYFEIKSVRLYTEIIDIISCNNNCGYFGVNFFMIESNEFICENCQNSIETGKSFDNQVKKCLMFFKLFCKQHKKIVNFFNYDKFEGFCYYCRDFEAIETDNKQLVNLIEQKQKWIYEEMVKYLNKNQLFVLENTDFLDFLSVKEKFRAIGDFLLKMNEFHFLDPQNKSSIKSNYILPGERLKFPGYYSEEITLLADSDCLISGLVIKPKKELISYLITIYCEGEIEMHQCYLLNSISGSHYLEKPFKIIKNNTYLIHLTFGIQDNFPIHQYHKIPYPQSLTQNSIVIVYSIFSQHKVSILTQGLYIT